MSAPIINPINTDFHSISTSLFISSHSDKMAMDNRLIICIMRINDGKVYQIEGINLIESLQNYKL